MFCSVRYKYEVTRISSKTSFLPQMLRGIHLRNCIYIIIVCFNVRLLRTTHSYVKSIELLSTIFHIVSFNLTTIFLEKTVENRTIALNNLSEGKEVKTNFTNDISYWFQYCRNIIGSSNKTKNVTETAIDLRFNTVIQTLLRGSFVQLFDAHQYFIRSHKHVPRRNKQPNNQQNNASSQHALFSKR